MARRTTGFELMLPARDEGTPAIRWLYRAVRAQILEGRLRPGARLPGSRALAVQYGLSRGTIVTAFEQLQSEGYVEGSVGSGTYVSKILPDPLFRVARPKETSSPPPGASKRRLSAFGQRVTLFPGYEVRLAAFDAAEIRAGVRELAAAERESKVRKKKGHGSYGSERI